MQIAAAGLWRARTYTSVVANVPVLIAAISGLALALRLFYLGKHSFWSDEILSVERAGGDWFEGGTHMVAYHTILHVWLNLGDSEITVRLLSVIFAVATLPVVYLLGARLFGPATGVLSSLLLAVNAFHIQYAQEARSYSLLVLLASLSSLFFVMGIQKRSRLVWAAYVVTSALVVYAHVFGGLLLVAQAVSLLFLGWRTVPWKWMLSASVGMGLLLDFVIRGAMGTVMEQVSPGTGSGGGGGIQWIPAPTLDGIKESFSVLTGNGIETGGELLLAAYAVPVGLALIIAGIAWVSALRRLTHRKASCTCARCTEIRASRITQGILPLSWKLTFVFLWLVVPMLALLAASFISPVFVARYTIVTLPALAIVASVGLVYTYQFFRNRMPGALSAVTSLALGAVLVALLALSGHGINRYYTEFQKEDWRGVTTLIASRWQPGDGILFYMPWSEPKFRFYVERLNLQLPESAYMVPESEWRQFIVDGEMGKNPDSQMIAQYLPDYYERVWVILAHYGSGNRPQVLHEIRSALRSSYPDENITTSGKVRVGLYRQGVTSSPGG